MLPVVSICCITYNQEAYIRNAIEGFLKQQTTFSFEIIIHDDASTDRTTTIIKEYTDKYPHQIVPVFQSENQWSKGIRIAPTFVWPLARGKYIAICDGDDYWTDPLKLQKQVDFLEANTEYGMVYTNHYKLVEDSNRIVKPKNYPKITNGDIYFKYLSSSFIGTLTVMAKTDMVKEFLNRFQEPLKSWVMGDRPLWLYISSKSKCGFLKDYTAIYRRNAKSVSSFDDIYNEIEFLKRSYDIRYYFIEHVRSIPDEIKNKLDDTYYRELLSLYFKANDKPKGKLIFRKMKNPRIKDYMHFLGTKNIFFRFMANLVFWSLNLSNRIRV